MNISCKARKTRKAFKTYQRKNLPGILKFYSKSNLLTFLNTCFDLSGTLVVSPKPQASSLYHGEIVLPLRGSPSSGNPRLPLDPFTVSASMRALLTLAASNPTASLPPGSSTEQGESSGMLMAVKNPSCSVGDCREGGP